MQIGHISLNKEHIKKLMQSLFQELLLKEDDIFLWALYLKM